MNLSYKDYCKDNPEGYWFKRKPYGWGWVPVKKEGWLVVLGFVLWMYWSAVWVFPHSALWYGVSIAAGVFALIVICYKKGEKPRWQWGQPIKKDLHFSRLFKVKEGKVETIKNWLTTLNTARKDEAIATFAYEGVTREVFVLFTGVDGQYYIAGFNETTGGTPGPSDKSVPINQEHTSIMKECLEPLSMNRGEVLMDLHI